MKLFLIICLIVLVAIFGYGFYYLQGELIKAKDNAGFYREKSSNLENRLVYLERAYRQKENRLEEIKDNLTELEDKVDLETLERYVPEETWKQISPAIERLRRLKESGGPS